MAEVVIYTKTGCPYCAAAIEQYLKDNIAFREVNVDQDAEALRTVREQYQAKKVPVIVKDGKLAEIGYQGGG